MAGVISLEEAARRTRVERRRIAELVQARKLEIKRDPVTGARGIDPDTLYIVTGGPPPKPSAPPKPPPTKPPPAPEPEKWMPGAADMAALIRLDDRGRALRIGELIRQHPHLRAWFRDNPLPPVFVKPMPPAAPDPPKPKPPPTPPFQPQWQSWPLHTQTAPRPHPAPVPPQAPSMPRAPAPAPRPNVAGLPQLMLRTFWVSFRNTLIVPIQRMAGPLVRAAALIGRLLALAVVAMFLWIGFHWLTRTNVAPPPRPGPIVVPTPQAPRSPGPRPRQAH